MPKNDAGHQTETKVGDVPSRRGVWWENWLRVGICADAIFENVIFSTLDALDTMKVLVTLQLEKEDTHGIRSIAIATITGMIAFLKWKKDINLYSQELCILETNDSIDRCRQD